VSRHLHFRGRAIGDVVAGAADPSREPALLFLFRSAAAWTLLSVTAEPVPHARRGDHDFVVELDVLTSVLDLEREVISRHGLLGWLKLLNETSADDEELAALHETWIADILARALSDERFRWHVDPRSEGDGDPADDAAALSMAARRLSEAGYIVAVPELSQRPAVAVDDDHVCGGVIIHVEGYCAVLAVVARGATRTIVLADDGLRRDHDATSAGRGSTAR